MNNLNNYKYERHALGEQQAPRSQVEIPRAANPQRKVALSQILHQNPSDGTHGTHVHGAQLQKGRDE